MILLQGTPHSQISSAAMIAAYCQKINLSDALQKLGALSKKLVDHRKPFIEVNGVKIPQSFIAYVAMVLIANASDDNAYRLSEEDVASLSSMWQNLPVPCSSEQEVEGTFIRLTLSEFYVQRSWRALLPRALVIYDKLWSRTPGASVLDISDAIQTEADLPIKELIMFGAFYADQVNGGAITEVYQEPSSDPDRTTAFISKQVKFFRWSECTYKEFKAEIGSTKSDTDERFKFNPLITRPLIIPERPPNGLTSASRLVPSTPCLSLAVPEQIYHRLYHRYQDKDNPRKNRFRTAFGYVFEEYVHTLLVHSSRPGMLLREQVYDIRRSLKTSDITRIDQNNAVCIEAKLSGVRLNTYLSGNLEDVRLDIARNIVKGVSQLITLRLNMLEEMKYPSLEVLRQCNEFEHLVVLYDNPPQTNSLLRRLALEHLRIECTPVPSDFHWHVIGIDDLENLLGIENIDLFEFLKEKRRKEDTDLMDFDEYMRYIRPDLKELSNPYLDSIGDNLLEEFRTMIREDRERRSPIGRDQVAK